MSWRWTGEDPLGAARHGDALFSTNDQHVLVEPRHDSKHGQYAFFIPLVISGASLTCLVWRAIRTSFQTSTKGPEGLDTVDGNHRSAGALERPGGHTIRAYKLLRLGGALALLALSIYQAVARDGGFAVHDCIIGLVFAYTAVLAILSITAKPGVQDQALHHATIVLFATFAAFFAVHVWPFMQVSQPTHHPHPATWFSTALLSITGLLAPLLIPAVPGPRSVGEAIRPEDRASTISRVTFSYMDKLIFYARRAPDVKINDLPDLAHVDSSISLRRQGVLKLDPLRTKARTHIFWTLAWYFAMDIALMMLWVTLNGIVQFMSPLALRSLLSELEGASVSAYKPWAWIIFITAGPILSSICSNQFYHVMTSMGIREEGIITQMIFDHALRLRLRTHTIKKASPCSDPETPTHSHEPQPSEDTVVEGSSEQDASSTTSGKDALEDTEEASDSIAGKVNNLMSSDMNTIVNAPLIFMVAGSVMQLAIALVFLYKLLGWSAFVGLGVIVMCIPLPTYAAKLAINTQVMKMKMSDKRVEAVTENINVLRMIKLFAWEPKILKGLDDRREDELKYIRREKLLNVILWTSEVLVPILSYMATAATYTVIMKKAYTPSIAFASLAIFDIVRNQLAMGSDFIPLALRAKVSYSRLNEFLRMGDLLPERPDRTVTAEAGFASNAPPNAIGFNAASFSWHKEEHLEGSATPSPSQRVFHLRADGPLIFKNGGLNIVVGPTGSGKTSLLMALLGEMHHNTYGPTSWLSLPREGGVAYAAQESWVLNETIRDNILFGQPFDECRYRKVLKQCGLERDLQIWEAGDQTEVGEKGLTLSGGQKARVTLARALYSSAQILLLDDVLAALDVHTAKNIVDQAFKGDLVKGRTIILVTHNLALVAPISDHVVVVARDGQIAEQGSPSEVLNMDPALRQEVAKEQAELEKVERMVAEVTDEREKKQTGKLIVAEEKALGHVSLAAIMLYLNSVGGFFTWALVIFCLAGGTAMSIAETSFIGYWSSQYENLPPSEVHPLRFFGVYALIDAVQITLVMSGFICMAVFSVRASRTIHTMLINSVFGAPLRWLDTVPVGRITTRCTQDLETIDMDLPDRLFGILQITLMLIMYYCTTVFMTGWISFISGALVATVGGWLGNMYLKAQLSVKREQSNAKAPVMSQVNVALQGLVSIRAYSAQNAFQAGLRDKLDTLMRCEKSFFTLNRWIGVRTESLGGLFAGAVTFYMVYKQNLGASGVGFVLSVIVAFSRQILYWIRVFNSVEVMANSLERVMDFVNIEQEPKAVESLKPPAYWPASGSLRVEGLTARYSDDSPEVLKELRFEANSGERIGVVGRTGAGKSSLALALLRGIKTSGKVYLDGRATDTVNLDALRSSITLIPQQPELLPGTVRESLDPFRQHDDAALNDALRAAGLFDLQDHGKRDETRGIESSMGGTSIVTKGDEDIHKITLDSEVRGGGANFSVGQRQIIALARAILRKSKFLILDEATAAIDYETDAVIQKFLRSELDKDVTVITIAHRLQTIMDSDKIMVLDAGKLVEYDSPRNLLRKGGLFRSLVDESNDRDHLIEMAKL